MDDRLCPRCRYYQLSNTAPSGLCNRCYRDRGKSPLFAGCDYERWADAREAGEPCSDTPPSAWDK